MASYFNISSLLIPLWLLTMLGFILAFLTTYVSIPSIIVVARAKSLCAIPNCRTSHTGATPTLGGIGIFTGFILSTIIIGGSYFKFEMRYIVAGLIILFMVGMKDDILIVDPRKKLAAQIFTAALISVLADIRISSFNGLFGLMDIPYLASIIVTIFVFIVIINGFNLIDGIDGLASGVGILTSSVLGLWFWNTGNIAYTVMSFALAGSLIAFFRYNVFSTKNKIFLGDTGSLITGLVMAILTIRFLQLDLLAIGDMYIQSAPAVAVGLLIVPLFDTLRVFTIRIMQSKSPFVADRQHLHHRLLQLGMTHLQSTLILLTVNLVFIVLCYFLQRIGILWLMGVILGTSILLSRFLVFYCRKRTKKIMDAEYVAVEKLKVLNKMTKLTNIQPNTPYLPVNKETRAISRLTVGKYDEQPGSIDTAEVENEATE